MSEKVYQDVIYLAGCAVNYMTPDIERVREMNLDDLYRAASRHNLTAITAMALESVGIHDKPFTQAKGKAIRKLAAMDADMMLLFSRFDAAGIWYMPLKGTLLKDLYPSYGMRQMSDHDVLFDSTKADDVKSIMESLGFTTVYFNRSVHDIYHKEPVSNFEMHRVLFTPASGDKLFDYYLNIKDRLVKDEETGCGYHFTDEDLYIYMTAHEYKHYSGGGTGLRSLLDKYVYIKQCGESMDWAYISGEAQKLGIWDFEKQNRILALHLFSEEGAVYQEMSAADKGMLSYIISSGTYGTIDHRVENTVKKVGSRGRYLLNRLFLPLETVQTAYPFFYKYKALLPALFLYRVGRGLTVSRKRTMKELKVLSKNK